MYISLKWKAVVFLSLVLIVISAVWTWRFIDKQLEEFNIGLEQSHKNQTVLLNELVNDGFLRLSQFAELISDKRSVQQSLDGEISSNSGSLKSSLEEDWLSYRTNLGLGYLAIYNSDKQILGAVNAPGMVFNAELQHAILGVLEKNTLSDEPENLIYCKQSCLMIVLQPFMSKQGKSGTIVLAQNMADIVRAFYDFSNSDVGILLGGEKVVGASYPERYLSNWKVYAWAVSDFNRIFPVVKKYSELNALDVGKQKEVFSSDGSHYLISLLELSDIKILGERAIFVSVEDRTSSYELLNSNNRNALSTVSWGLLTAEFIMLLLIHTPMKKLANITEALHLLPQQHFSQAVQKMDGRKSLFMDELSTLQHSTVYVTRELDKLHREIRLKNESLQEQVAALTRSRSFLTRLFDNSQIFIITQDFDFHIYSTNKKFDSLYDETPLNFTDLIYDERELEEFKVMVESLIQHKTEIFQQEYNLVDKNNNNLIITWTHALVEDEQGSPIILSIGMDQTLQKAAENELRWMANNDGLTSIGNRRSFNATIREMLEGGVRGALVFIDVNRFKQINDIYGHNAGDQVLIDIANKLRKSTRSSDTISRFAGDEFTILMVNIKHDDLTEVLKKLSTELSSSIQLEDGRSVQYTVSIGASLFPEQGSDPQSLIINADRAMYHAKKKGVGQWRIFDSSDERVYQIKQDHNLSLAIKHALKNSSFKLVYQPVLDIQKNQISHYEVLIRLEDESGQKISPSVFIPLAEKIGEIRNIDAWVLEHALSKLRDRLSKGDDLTLAINISAPTMQADDFPELVFSVLNKYKIDSRRLIIELTETAYIENFQQVLKNLNQITKNRVRVAIDDFGVGFSSFTYLKKLPLSYVKLDGSYIKNLTNSPDDQIFVKSLSAMVSAFGMEIIAEFVGDQQTLCMINELGVTHGQGYFIGKPVPFEACVKNVELLVYK